MKTQIDNLVRGIQHDLPQPSPAVPELATFSQAIGADGFSKAEAQRAILGRWTEDMTLPTDVRDYGIRPKPTNWGIRATSYRSLGRMTIVQRLRDFSSDKSMSA